MTHTDGDARWSINFLIGLPLLILLIIALIVGTAFMFRAYRNDVNSWGRDGMLLAFAIGLGLVTVIVIAVTAGGFYPYEKEYHAYVKKVGTVESVSKRLLPSGDAMQEKFVVHYTDGREFGCEDTRCALVKPGDRLVLACIRKWDYQASDGYDCGFVERRGS